MALAVLKSIIELIEKVDPKASENSVMIKIDEAISAIQALGL
jgi:hypothetical protein